jgi:translation initiation factor IF-2
MLRINQLAKELGVSNHEVINALERHLGIQGKSHSSNLSDGQVNSLRLIIKNKANSKEEVAASTQSLAPSAKVAQSIVRIVKPAYPHASVIPAGKSVVLIKKPEGLHPLESALVEVDPSLDANRSSEESMVRQSTQLVDSTNVITENPAMQREGFSHLRISTTPVAIQKPKEPARYIQLPKQVPPRNRSESGSRQQHVRSGQQQAQVQRSGLPQAGKTLLPMAANTGKGAVKHEVAINTTPQTQIQPTRRTFIPPSITELRSDSGFTRIKMSDTPAPAPRNLEPARYIQLPQARRPATSARPNNSTSRPGSSGRPGSGAARPSGTSGPRSGSSSSGNRGPFLPTTATPDLSVQKSPGRGGHFTGKRKDDKRTRAERMAEELELKLRQPRSSSQKIATEYIDQELGIVMLSEGVSVKELAEKCSRPAKDVVAKLLHRGILVTINQPLDTELAKEIAREFGYLADIVTFEEDIQISAEESSVVVGEKLWRPPVVTIMGHVDHGKTSLLDAIRSSKIAASEAGGITQAIGAYHVEVSDSDGLARKIVFVDTPGHKAFTKMRARGAKITDIVILVVAADDGVMPQTIEAINHAKAAGVSIVVVINKIDKLDAEPDKVERELLQHGVQTESYGGDVPCVRVSAKTKEGLDVLLETLLLVADLKDLKAVYSCPASGSIIEARLDRGRGPVATVMIQQGTLHVGDIFVAGSTMGRVRAMFSDRLERISEATPSMAVQILGFEDVPVSGDTFQILENESRARTIISFRREKAGIAAQSKQRVTLENMFSIMKEDQIKELPLIVKGDTQGSVESLVGSLNQLSTDKVRVRIIHSAAGTVTENDVLLAEASKASIIAFGVKLERKVDELSQEHNVDVRFHDTIYKVTEEITAAMVGLLDTIKKETIHGLADVRQIFKVNKSVIAGCFILEGKVQKAYRARVKRGADMLWDGNIKTLRRFKDDVSEVKNGLDCGIELDTFVGLREGDAIEFYTLEKVAATSLS